MSHGLQPSPSGPVKSDVAKVWDTRTMSSSVRKGLVQVAANHAHLNGFLKLILHAQVDVGRAAEFLHRLRFLFSRQREVEAQPVLEFYLNLYERPELLPSEDAAIRINEIYRAE